jgi:hypothetical protein
VRATGNLVSGIIIDVHDRRTVDTVDIEYGQRDGRGAKAEIAVWDSYDYETGDDVDVYVDTKGNAVMANAFSTGSYWSAYFAIHLTVGGLLLVLIAVGRVIWDRMRKA